MVTRSAQENTRQPIWRRAREHHGRSLREVARAAGIDPGHLSRVERGQAQLSLDATRRLAAVLGLDEITEVLGTIMREQG